MSRLQPYRSKMPVQIIRALDVASRITLFMVGQSGPLSFTFKDRLDHKYKTTIGSQLKCSCSPNKHDHCIHTLYVMLKIFKVSPQNPIIWQAAYVDSELSDLLAGKYTVLSNRSIIRPMFQVDEDQLPSNIMYRRQKQQDMKNNNIPEAKVQRMQLNQQSVCPICQQNMTQDMNLSYCKLSCGNNFHLECLKVWAKHKKTTQTSITCPMCRCSMGENFLYELEVQQRQYNKKQLQKIKIKYKCSACGVTDIPNNVHKCLLCTSFQLCQSCYKANKHIKHPFVKQSDADGKWRGAEERRQAEIKMKNMIDNKRKQKNMNQKLIEKLRKVEEDPSKLLDYVASSYPYVSKYISDNVDPYKKLDLSDDMKCGKCNAKKMLFLRRLTCGHFVDHECLKENIRKQRFYCDQCGSKVLKGYQNLVERQKQLQNQKKKQEINFDVSQEFNPKTMEDYNFVLPEQATLNDILGRVREINGEDFFENNRMRQRIISNVVRNSAYQSANNEMRSSNRHSRMLSTNHPNNLPRSTVHQQSRNRAQTNHNANNNIRIRSIARSTHETVPPRNSSRNKSERKNSKKNRQDLGLMIEAMIGRKVF